MADFSKDFFQGETRDGFYIEPMMKCTWAAEIEVLEVVAEICDKHNIRYFADCGTLLGAVRHQGFIPWDDDMDICMFREEYEYFLKIAPTELPSGWSVHSVYNHPFTDQLHAVVRNADRINYSPEHLKRFHGCPYTTGLDLYPLDTLAPTPEEDRTICELLKILVHTAHTYNENPQQTLELLPEIEKLCGITLNRSENIMNQLMLTANQVCQLYNSSNGCFVSFYPEHADKNQGLRLQSAWYRERIPLPFENITIMAPVEYDSILRQYYGDYMVPVQGTQSHEYPYYKKQERLLAECWADMRRNELL